MAPPRPHRITTCHVLCILLITILPACTSPGPGLRESSEAADDLYGELVQATTNYRHALITEFSKRDQVATVLTVNGGDDPPTWLMQADADEAARLFLQSGKPRYGADEATKKVQVSLMAVEQLVRLYRTHYGAIARFIRIEVLDLDDVTALTGRINEASKDLFGDDGAGQ